MDRSKSAASSAEGQHGTDWSGLSDADLVVIHRALGVVTGPSLGVSAVYFRAGAEIRRREVGQGHESLRAAQMHEENRVSPAWKVRKEMEAQEVPDSTDPKVTRVEIGRGPIGEDDPTPCDSFLFRTDVLDIDAGAYKEGEVLLNRQDDTVRLTYPGITDALIQLLGASLTDMDAVDRILREAFPNLVQLIRV